MHQVPSGLKPFSQNNLKQASPTAFRKRYMDKNLTFVKEYKKIIKPKCVQSF